jgi:hypothetical protein
MLSFVESMLGGNLTIYAGAKDFSRKAKKGTYLLYRIVLG